MCPLIHQVFHRLRGLCDNVDAGVEHFQDYEACFNLGPNPSGLKLRVRKAQDVDAPYQLRYLGQAETDRTKPTLVRSCIDVACTSSIVEYLNELGAMVEFEYRISGYMFRKGRMKITVAKVFKGNVQKPEPISQSYLVELSVIAPIGQEQIGDEMKAFAEQLKPLVNLDKIDYKRFSHTLP